MWRSARHMNFLRVASDGRIALALEAGDWRPVSLFDKMAGIDCHFMSL